jgi:HD-like signal output (HDOD) protein/nitrogen-specific signal transduction histidine kinase
MAKNSNKTLEKIDVTHLPSLPHVLLKLLEICNKENSTFADLAHVIGQDSALSAKIMAVASSARFGKSSKVESLVSTLMVLGMDAVKSVAISASIFHVFSQLSNPALLDLKRYWRHALMCATLAKALAKHNDYPVPEEAFLTGLLHDVGQLVLWANFPKEYGPIFTAADDTAAAALEQEQLGTTHTEVGAWLVESWHLQSFMADAVLYHHELPERVMDAHPLVKIIHAANALCIDKPDSNAVIEAERTLGVPGPALEQILMQSQESVQQLAEALDIDIGAPEGSEQAEDATTRVKRRSDATKPAAPSQESADNAKKLQLAREVRDMAFLDSARRILTGATGEEAILSALRQGLELLFGVSGALFFLHDTESGTLHGKQVGDDDDLLNELAIPLSSKSSLLVQSLSEKTPLHSFNRKGDISIADEQITRLTQQEGILCIPMITRNTQLGVIVLGIDKISLPRLEKQTKLMSLYANEVAAMLQSSSTPPMKTQAPQPPDQDTANDAMRKVVHEVNNPLSVVKNYLRILQTRLQEQDPAQADIKIINDEINRVATIVRGLSDTTRNAVEKSKGSGTTDVNGIITDLIKFTQEALLNPHKIKAELDLDRAMPPLKIDPNKIKQILLNLIKNAAEAMPKGGLLSIATRGNLNLDGAPFFEIVVKDNGPGIPSHIMDQLFEPVTTTKDEGHAGLGLSIVKDLVKELDGYITCKNNGEAGTSFQLLLPSMPISAAQ